MDGSVDLKINETLFLADAGLVCIAGEVQVLPLFSLQEVYN